MPDKKPTIMRAFKISEISAVTTPAQEGATMTIMKAKGAGPERKKGESDADYQSRMKEEGFGKAAMLTSPTEGHVHTIVTDVGHGPMTHGDSTYVDGHSHPWIRQENGIVTIGEAQGHAHEIGLMTKDATAKEHTMPEKKPTADAVTQEAFDALQKRAERSDKILALSEDHRSHLYTLKGAEAQDAFLEKSADERTSELATIAAGDPVVFKAADGTEFRKSDDPRLVKMAKEREADRKELMLEKAARQNAELAKRVADDFGHLPGEPAVKVALLKAVEGISDPDARKAALETLKASDAGIGEAMVRSGTSTPAVTNDAEAELEKLATEKAAKDSIPFVKAYDQVLNTAKGQELYAKAVGDA